MALMGVTVSRQSLEEPSEKWQPTTDPQRLLYYAGIGDCEGVQRLLNAGVKSQVNDDKDGFCGLMDHFKLKSFSGTALEIAIHQEKGEVIRLLFERASKIDGGIEHCRKILSWPVEHLIANADRDEGRKVSLIFHYCNAYNLQLNKRFLDSAVGYSSLFSLRAILKIASKEFGFDQRLHSVLLSFLHSDVAKIVTEYHIGECPQLVDCSDKGFSYPLQKVIRSYQYQWCSPNRKAAQKKKKIVQLLLDSRANPCTVAYGTTALALATRKNSGVPRPIKKLIVEAAKAQQAKEEAERAKQEAERAKHVSSNTRSRKRLAAGELIYTEPKTRKK